MPEVLLTGIKFGESPRWHDGRLWFCDWATQEVIAVDTEGLKTVARGISGASTPRRGCRG